MKSAASWTAWSVLLLGIAASGLCAEPAAPPVLPLTGVIIVLDPGHAVKDDAGKIINPGARARRGVYERDVVLNVAEKLTPLLEAQGARVYQTRTRGNPWRYGPGRDADNRSRAIFANGMGAQAYVRLHCDWNRTKSFKGFTTYYYRWDSRPLAESLHHALARTLRTHRDHGIHRRSFVSVTARMPSVLLEMGVLSNKKEGKELASDAYQTRVAQAISKGLVNYFARSQQSAPVSQSL